MSIGALSYTSFSQCYPSYESQPKTSVEILHEAIIKGASLSDILSLITPENVNAYHNNKTAIHLVVNNLSLLEALVERGADINALTEDDHHYSALFLAVSNDSNSSAEFLIKKGAALNLKYTDDQNTVLHLASIGQNQIVELLCKHGADMKIQNKEQKTALHMASSLNCDQIATLLVSKSPELIHIPDKDGWTPLHYAAAHNSIETAKKLIEAGAYINACAKKKETPLSIAVRNSWVKMVRYLLEQNADTEIKSGKKEKTALHYATTVEILKMLLEKGADLNSKTKEREYILQTAVKYGRASIVRFLIAENEIGVDQRGGVNYWTSLHYAVYTGKFEIASFLLDNKADIHAPTLSGKSVLYLAVEGGYEDVVELVLSKKVDVNYDCGIEFGAALHYAAHVGDLENAKRLLSAGANINACISFHEKYSFAFGTDGISVLGMAARAGQLEMVQFLLEKGASLHQKCGPHELTALHYAAGFTKNLSVFELLISKKSDPLALTNNGHTLLHIAAYFGNDLLIPFCLDKGIPINAKESEQESTPLHVAAERGYPIMVQKLITAGANTFYKNKSNKSSLKLVLQGSFALEQTKNLSTETKSTRLKEYEATFNILLDLEIKRLETCCKNFNKTKLAIFELFQCLRTFSDYLHFLRMNTSQCAVFRNSMLEKLYPYIFESLLKQEFWQKIMSLPFDSFAPKQLSRFCDNLRMIKLIFSSVLQPPLNLRFVQENIDPILKENGARLEHTHSQNNVLQMGDLETQERDFDEQDLYMILSELGVGSNSSNYSAAESYLNFLESAPEDLSLVGTSGEDLRNIGVDFTLRFISFLILKQTEVMEKRNLWNTCLQKLEEMKKFSEKESLEELNTLSTKIQTYLSAPTEEFLKGEAKLITTMRECHKAYCLSTLRAYIRNQKEHASKKQKIEE